MFKIGEVVRSQINVEKAILRLAGKDLATSERLTVTQDMVSRLQEAVSILSVKSELLELEAELEANLSDLTPEGVRSPHHMRKQLNSFLLVGSATENKPHGADERTDVLAVQAASSESAASTEAERVRSRTLKVKPN